MVLREGGRVAQDGDAYDGQMLESTPSTRYDASVVAP